MRRSILLTILVAFAIAAILLVRWHREPAPSTASTQAAATSAQTPAAADAQMRAGVVAATKNERAAPEPADDRPFTEIRPDLERRALAGDAAAARRLGVTLANCNHFVDVPDEKLEEIVVEQEARGFTMKDRGRVVPPEELLNLFKLSFQQKRRDCKGATGLNESDASKKSFQWIDRAAALGDADAQALYGALAFAGFDARNALVDAETMRDRKHFAIDYLQRSLAQGDALALVQMAGRYQDGLLVPADPEMAYAYAYAYSLTTRASELVPGLIDEMLVQRSAPLDDAALDRARAEGARLAACCGIAATGAP
jgi:TPR repeat protein